MADFAIAADQVGAYELALPAGTQLHIAADNASGRYHRLQMQVIHHSGAAPIYVSTVGKVEPRDPRSVIVMPASFVEIPAPPDGDVWLVSDQAATVSVLRS